MIKRILHYAKLLPAYLSARAYRIVDPIIRLLPVKSRMHYGVVIVRTDGIGDFALWASAIPTIREKYKDKTIAYVFPDSYLTIVEKLDLFDGLIPFSKKGAERSFGKHISIVWRLKQLSADIVINPTRYRIYPSDFLVSMISAPQKIGVLIKRAGLINKLLDSYYTNLIEIPSIKHEMLNTEYFTRVITNENYVHKLADFRKLAEGYNSPIDTNYCVIALSSADEYKIWEVEKVSEIINSIPKKYKVVLTGFGAKDIERANYIFANHSDGSRIINMVNKTSMLSLTQLVVKSSFVLGNDSATVHLAAACRVPSICYLAGAAYEEFIPYPSSINDIKYHPRAVSFPMDCFGCHYRCTKEEKSFKALLCIRNITVDMVNHQLQILLNEIETN